MRITDLEIRSWFMYHPPMQDERVKYEAIREAGRKLAFVIRDACPEGADTTAAIRKVREAVMTANASVACGGK
jgi:hypothetical protein